jgi:CDP-glycerol glycerophosphotransferase (TagB/SpsB family)
MHLPYDYKKAFREGALLLTDYSSVAFDFAYLGKPVIYTRFDEDQVYGGQHIFTKIYISAEKDGFGPVVKSYDSTIKELLKSVKNGFVMSEKYQMRVKNFYFHHDRENCARLLSVMKDA